MARIGRRGKIQHAPRRDRVHRLRDRPVLKRPLVEIRDVIDDDVAVVGRCGQALDVGGHRRHAAETGGEVERRAGRHVVHDLEHGRAFVARACLAWNNGDDGWQIAGGLARRQCVDPVRQHAHLGPGAGLAAGVGHTGLVRGHALPGRITDIGHGTGGQAF